MKYLAINSYDYLSTGNIAHDIAEKMKAEGYECYFASHFNKNNYENSYHVHSNKFVSFINKVLCRVDGSDGFHNKKSTKKLIKWIDRIKPDIIHIHNLHGCWINLPLLFNYLSKSNAKIIWTLHDCWLFTGRCAHFDFNCCSKWKAECKNCKFKNQYPRAIFLDRSDHFFRKKRLLFSMIKDKCTFVCPSAWLFSLLKESYLKDFESIVINNGIKFSIPEKIIDLRDEYNLKDKKIILSLAAPLDIRKGIDYIKKCILYFNNLKNDNKVFVLIGLNKKQIVHFSKYKNCIPFGLILDRDRLFSWYETADVFLNPTLEDNFPTVVIEAISFGTPALCFNSGGTCETINNFPQLIVEKGDLQTLIGKLKYIEKTSQLKKDLILTSKNYSKDKMLEKYFDLVNSKIKSNN